jgi:peroxiredoxin
MPAKVRFLFSLKPTDLFSSLPVALEITCGWCVADFKDKKVVLVAVPGAFTPTCQAAHVTGYIEHLKELKEKGADRIIFIAYNDPFVMSAWGKANDITDDSIVSSLLHFLRIYIYVYI